MKVLKRKLFVWIITLFLLQGCTSGHFLPKDWASESPNYLTEISILERLKKIGQQKGELQYLVLGDSVALGQGSTDGEGGYTSLISQYLRKNQLHVKYINRAISGQTSEQLLQRLKTTTHLQEEIAQADLISLTIGGNDLLKRLLQEKNPMAILTQFYEIQENYKTNLNEVLSEIRQLNPDAPILTTSLYNPVPPSNEYYTWAEKLMKKWNDGMKEIAGEFSDVNVIDIEGFHSAKWLADDIHPNDEGYGWIAQKCVQAINAKNEQRCCIDFSREGKIFLKSLQKKQ